MSVKRLKRSDNLKTVGKKKTVASGVSLPTGMSEGPKDLFSLTMCLYGTKGIGKTSLTALFPDALNFQFEPGRRNIRMWTVPQAKEPSLDWDSFKDYVSILLRKTEDIKRVPRVIVIDTIDRCYEACFEAVCKRWDVEHPSDPKVEKLYGRVWTDIRMEFTHTLDSLKEKYCCIFISHERERPIPGTELMQVAPTCTPSCWEYMKAGTDLAFFYGYRGKERVLIMQGNEDVWASCQVDGHFIHPVSKEPLAMINMGQTARTALDSLTAAWENKMDGWTVNDLYEMEVVEPRKVREMIKKRRPKKSKG